MSITMGVGLFPTEPVERMRYLVHHAEQLGYHNVWVGDSQNIWRESSIVMGAAAVGTSRVVIGTGVTNPVTRHRSALASTWATLHEMTGGRVAMGIGVGDSAMYTMGLKPAKLRELEEAIAELRTLWRGESAREGMSDAEYRLSYVDPAKPRTVPVYIGASGPRILELAGRVGDGVIVLVGTDPRFIKSALGTIAEGAAQSGRTLEDLHLVLWAPTAIDQDGVAARDLVRSHVARVVMRPLAAELGPEQNEAVERIRAAYDYYEHMQVEAAHSQMVPDSLVDSFALAGTPEECAARVREIKALGIDQIAIIPYVGATGDRAETMSAFADIVHGVV